MNNSLFHSTCVVLYQEPSIFMDIDEKMISCVILFNKSLVRMPAEFWIVCLGHVGLC